MKKQSYKNLSHFKPIIYVTVCIFIFMITLPIILMDSDKNIDLNSNEKVEESMSKNIINEISIDSDNTVSVYITSEDRIEEVDVEEYVCGVIANEMPVSFDEEALKAQAIASRTYMMSKKMNHCKSAKGADICDSVHCQVYSSKQDNLNKWKNIDAEKNWEKIKDAVESTQGMVLTYKGELALYPVFFSTSSGKTESSKDASWDDVPYLKSVESPGEEIAPNFESKKEMSVSEFVNTVNSKYPKCGVKTSNIDTSVKVLSRSDAGGVISLSLGNTTVKGSDLRFLLGLNSTNFTYDINGRDIIFNCRGYGHGVGMSQWGANVMAKNGKKCDEILKHYYTGVEISKLKLSK